MLCPNLLCRVLSAGFLTKRLRYLIVSNVSNSCLGQKPKPKDKTSISASLRGCEERLIISADLGSGSVCEVDLFSVGVVTGCFELVWILKKCQF